tara:strand:- start:1510 stop:1962 length:453 start_codon:yes stop_codon:yes gene_type:complete
MSDLDPLDNQIIDILKKDGRASNASIARELDLTEGTVRRRLKRILDEDYVHVTVLMDAGKMGYVSEALVGVQVDPDKVDEVARHIADLSEVGWVALTTGTYDVFAWTALPSPEELGVFLRTRIGTIPGVRRTETFVNLSVMKRGHIAPFL